MKRLLKVTMMTGLLTLLKMLMGFAIAKVVAVHSGPSGMAMLGQVQNLVGSLNGLVNAPTGSGVIRFTAENREYGIERCSRWWVASFQWVAVISAIVIPVGLLLSEQIALILFEEPSLKWVVVTTVCVLPLSAFGTFCNSVINGQQQYQRYVSLGMISVVLSTCAMLSMIYFYGVEGALLAASVQGALVGAVMLIFNVRQPWFKIQYWWGSADKEARRDIGNYILMAVTSSITVPIALIVIRNMLISNVGWVSTGQWQAIWKISEVYLGVITLSLGTYYLPRLSSLTKTQDIIKEIHKTSLVVIPIACSLALIVYFFRDVIITVLFTDEFRDARELFLIQLVGDVVKVASWLYAFTMISKGAVKWFVFSEIVFSVLFVLLSYVFIDWYGVKGVSLAYLINYTIYFFFITRNLKAIIK